MSSPTCCRSSTARFLADSRGDIQRGLDVVEFACGIPHLLKGEYSEGAGPGIDVYSMRQPLGVVAGITPFNFPAMIPLWMIAPAIALRKCLHPETIGTRSFRFRCALPNSRSRPDCRLGILNVVHGDKEMVDAILDHPDIKAVSFVGSSDIANYVYRPRRGAR